MLSNKAKDALRSSQTIQGKIADALARTIYSVSRWIEDDNKMLETETSIRIIREETGLTDSEILIESPIQK